MSEETQKTKAVDLGEAGQTGLLRTYGFEMGQVFEEILPELRGYRGIQVYRQMADNDPVIGAILFAIEMLIRQIPWTVQAADNSAEAEKAQEFFEGVMDDMSHSWESVISEICSMFTYGHAVLEIVWKIRGGPDEEDPRRRSKFSDGKIGIRKLSMRAQKTITNWLFDENDGIQGIEQTAYNNMPVKIPIEKLLLFRTKETLGNPEGRSILRNVVKSTTLKTRIEEVEAIGVERDLVGLPVMRLPAAIMDSNADTLTAAAYASYQALVSGIRRDRREGVILPNTRDGDGNYIFDLTLLSSGGARQFDTTKIIDRYARVIATSVLADFIFLGQQAVGSFALSSDKTALFSTAMGGFANSIESVFNMHLIPRWHRLNGGIPETMPQIRHGDIESLDLGALGAFVTALSGAGAPLFPDIDLENHLREAAGLPLAPEDREDLIDTPPMPGQQDGVADQSTTPQPNPTKKEDPKAQQ